MYKYGTWLLILLLSACANPDKRQNNDYAERDDYTSNIDMEIEESITPQVYSLVATRATNKMLDNTKVLYETNNRPTLFITDIKKVDAGVPDGFYSSRKVTRNIIEGSKTFSVVNDLNEADYILEIWVGRGGNDNSPEIIYKLILIDRQNVKVGDWVETIKRIRNDDRSWW